MMTCPNDTGRCILSNSVSFDESDATLRFTAEIASDLLEVEPLLTNLKLFWHRAGIKDKLLFYLEMIVTELINNSIIHGNCCQQDKKVWVRSEIGNGQVIVQIEDQGAGFDYQHWLKKDLDLLADRGRGIFLARTMANLIKYEKNGAKVTIAISLEPGEEMKYG